MSNKAAIDINAMAVADAPDLSGDPVIQTEVDLLCILADFPELLPTVQEAITEDMISDSEAGKLIKNFIFKGITINHSIIEESLKNSIFTLKRNSFSSAGIESILGSIIYHYKLKYLMHRLPTKLMKAKTLESAAIEIEKAQQALVRGCLTKDKLNKRAMFAEAQSYQIRQEETYKTGVVGFDNLIRTGLMMSHLLVFAADTGAGKTLFCTQIIENIASIYGVKVGWFCLEMPTIDMIHRRISLYLQNSSFHDIINKTISEIEYEHALALAESRDIYTFDDIFDFNTICATIRNLASSGFKFFVIDYLQLISCSIPGYNERQLLDYMIVYFKQMCKRYQISIFVISQFSKGDDFKMKSDASIVKREPMLRDLKGTTAIAQTADRVVMLWCPPEEMDGELSLLPQRLIKWILAKNRHGDPGKGWIVHDKKTGRITDASQDRIEHYYKIKEALEAAKNPSYKYNNRNNNNKF